MTLTLYVNRSDNKTINKDIAYVGDLSGTMKYATSILNPSILIEMDNGVIDYDIDLQAENDDIAYTDDSNEYDLSININYDIFACNYCYIQEFQRYYFIDNIIIQNNKLFMLALSVDADESHKNQFLNLDAFVSRNEFDFNPFVKDDLITYYYDKDIDEYVLPKGDYINTTFRTDLDIISGNIFLSVINKYVGLNTNVSVSPIDSLPIIKNSVVCADASYVTYTTFLASLVTLSKALQQDDTYNDFILSCVAFPFTIEDSEDDEVLYLGNRPCIYTKGLTSGFEPVLVNKPRNSLPKYMIVADFTLTAESFLDYEPYTQYELYLPYLSWIPVSADDILNNRIIVYYVVDYPSGSSQVCVYDVTNSKLIYSGSAQLGVKIGLTSTSQKELNDIHSSNNISLGVGLLTSALSIVGGIATMNPVAVGGGLLSGGATITKYAHNENTNYLHANGSVSSGLSGLYMCQDVKIKKTKLKPKNYNNDFAKLFGKPLNEYRNLSALKGFTQISDIHLDDIKATKSEIEMIASSLKNGVIIK